MLRYEDNLEYSFSFSYYYSKCFIQNPNVVLFYTKVCKDMLPKYYSAENECPDKTCQHFEQDGLCENIWRDAVSTTCGKSISHSGNKIKSLCQNSCGHCSKKPLFKNVPRYSKYTASSL